MLLTVSVAAARRGLFVNDAQTGTFTLVRKSIVADIVLSLTILAVLLAAIIAPLVMLGSSVFDWLTVAALVLLVPIIMYFFARKQSPTMSSPISLDTPAGKRYVLGSLAQIPGTYGISTLALARSAMQNLAPGSVVVAVAATDELLAGYVKLGFTEDAERRVYKVM